MLKLKKKILVLSMTIIILFSVIVTADAYVLKYHWDRVGTGNLNVTYKWDASMPFTSVWKDAFNNSISDWNGTPTKARYAYSSSATNSLGIVSVANGAFGYCNITIDTNLHIQKFIASGNTATTSSFTNTMRRSVTGHELGHAWGLGDELFASPIPLMDTNRDRSNIYVPQQDDINGINAMYP